MQAIKEREVIPSSASTTAEKLVNNLATKLTYLNRDTDAHLIRLKDKKDKRDPNTREPRRMPDINPEKSMWSLVKAMRENGFPSLALAIAAVHVGELRIKDGRGFPSNVRAARFRICLGAVEDASLIFSQNDASLLNGQIKGANAYRIGATPGEVALTYSEMDTEARLLGFENIVAAGYRADTLINQEGFIPSPGMELMRSKFLSIHRLPRTKMAR